MISRFGTTNYKSIKTLNLDMRPFMVLVGPNGSGKTNVVRALELFGEIIRRGTIEPVFEQGYDQLIHREKKPARGGLSFTATVPLPADVLARSMHTSLASTKQQGLFQEVTRPLGEVQVQFGLFLSGSVGTGEIAIGEELLALKSGDWQTSVKVRGEHVTVEGGEDPRINWMMARSILGVTPAARIEPRRRELESAISDFLGAEEGAEGLLRLLNWQRLLSPWIRHVRDAVRVTRLRLDASALRRDSTFDETSRGLIGPNGEGLAIAVARLRGQGKKPSPAFAGVIQGLQAVFPRIEDVNFERIQPGRVVLKFRERGIADDLGGSNVSDGVLHALALLIALDGGLGGSGMLAIEEPENAIHPWSLRTIMERAQERPTRQLLFTTHSETLVDSVRDPASLYVVENADVGTVVTPAVKRSRALSGILRESGQKLGEVWLDGTLGGVPGGEP